MAKVQARKVLERSDRFDGDEDEPSRFTARDDGIEVEMPSGKTIIMRPVHIASVTEMAATWWKSHWAAIYDSDDG